MGLSKQIKKTPVVVGNCTGFAVNRVFFPYTMSACLLLDLGCDPYAIDNAIRHGFWVVHPHSFPLVHFIRSPRDSRSLLNAGVMEVYALLAHLVVYNTLQTFVGERRRITEVYVHAWWFACQSCHVGDECRGVKQRELKKAAAAAVAASTVGGGE